MFEKERGLIREAKNLTEKEALERMVVNPEMLDPLIYILFTVDAGVNEILSFKDYCILMKQKALYSNNIKLLKKVLECEKNYC
ncbi:hypothetical protein [Priestia endophytica]|uniref:hypothetical protein n=1 Tax=Priestia endophytica TaxID=135735 RepID=UPI00124F2AE2|nr:hypothetical protein [Priestia endophytica]KAB2489977.1 hypothetical protein F8155_21540 [Priestia endophytica]